MQQLADEFGVVTVVVNGLEVDSVTIRNKWKNHYDATSLAAAIVGLLRRLLPPEPQPDEPVRSGSKRALTPEEVSHFWAQFALYQRKKQQRIRRALAGETAPRRQFEETTHPGGHADARYSMGRLVELGIDPEWLANTPMQTVSKTITETLRQRPLVTEPPIDPELADLRRHRAALLGLLTGK